MAAVLAGSLADPQTFGEDLVHNARRTAEIAPHRCVGCEDYHIIFTTSRITGHAGGIGTDRSQMVDAIGRHVASRLAAGPNDVDVVMVGSSDTGILATCAHAVAVHAPAGIDRVRFTVLDLCGTPLELCRDYAARHHINLDCAQIDFVATARTFPADVIVHHSLSRFLAPDSRAATLAKFGRWLKPDGRMAFSVAIERPDRVWGLERRKTRRATLLAKVAAGEVAIYEPLERFARRVADQAARREQRFDFYGADEVRQLIAAADLEALSFQVVPAARPSDGDQLVTRERVFAVLARRKG